PSLEQVAGKVGMAKATIYYHFGSKEELYWAVLWPITLETVDHMEEIVTREAPARDLIIEVMRAAAVRARDPRQRYVYYQELVPLSEEMRSLFRKQVRRYQQLFGVLIRRGQEEGSVVSGLNPYMLGMMVIGGIARTARWYDPNGEVGPGEFSETLMKLFLNGLLVTPYGADERDAGC